MKKLSYLYPISEGIGEANEGEEVSSEYWMVDQGFGVYQV